MPVLKKHTTVLFVVGLALGAAISLVAGDLFTGSAYQSGEENCVKQLNFLNPHIVCRGTQQVIDKKGYRFFEETLSQEFQELERSEGIRISMYFRDLFAGPTFGVREKELFSPASLFKVPIMIAYLKLAENDPRVLDAKLVWKPLPGELVPPSDPDRGVVPGQEYSVRELIGKMIIFSDNTAKDLLKQNLGLVSGDDEFLNSVYIELGLTLPDHEQEDFITVKQYATLYRVLFNASYLDEGKSQEALELLIQAGFRQGLIAGVPTNIPVAHKFGNRDLGDSQQLHDCGIVYYPHNPYLLCIMTRGKDQQRLAQVIASTSKKVFDEFDSRAKSK